MSTFYYGPALDSELAHRRSTLLRDAALHRLARHARTAARSASAAPRPVFTQPARPATAPVPAEASAGPAGTARDQVTRAA